MGGSIVRKWVLLAGFPTLISAFRARNLCCINSIKLVSHICFPHLGQANITSKLLLGTLKWLAPPSDGSKIATMTEKTRYDPMGTKSNGKFRCVKKVIGCCVPFVLVLGAVAFYFQSTVSLPPPATSLTAASAQHPFMNSMGMRFVPVPITGGATSGKRVLFSIWDTRVYDYNVYAPSHTRVDSNWIDWACNFPASWVGNDYPVTDVSWNDAKAFCAWLTRKERNEGKIGTDYEYRLPTDHEWSCAIGIGALENPNAAPAAKDGVGNYNSDLKVRKFNGPSPVGSFKPNNYGLYDMGGNVWQWCEDWYDASKKERVMRGASWGDFDPGFIVSSGRNKVAPTYCDGFLGFRCVLAPVLVSY